MMDVVTEKDRAVPVLVEILRHEKGSSARAAYALGQLARQAATAIPALREQLAHEDVDLRVAVLWALGRIGDGSAETLSVVAKLADAPQQAVRTAAVRFLAANAGTPAARSRLVELLSSRELALEAAWALARAGVNEPKAVDACLGALTDSSERDQRIRTMSAIAWLAAPDDRLKEAVIKALGADHPMLRRQAIETLGLWKTDRPELVRAATEMLPSEHSPLRATAALALVRIGRRDDAVVAVVVDTLGAEHGLARIRVAEAAVSIGQHAERVPSILTEALRDDNAGIREEAANAIGRTKSDSPSIREGLRRGSQDREPTVRLAAQWALDRLDGGYGRELWTAAAERRAAYLGVLVQTRVTKRPDEGQEYAACRRVRSRRDRRQRRWSSVTC